VGNWLPITSKLIPKPSNLVYLAEVAVLTRLATGVARVLENRPSKQNDPNVTEGQKKQAMVERFFVEILGTMGYMACLHLGQDVVDKISNRLSKNEDLLRDALDLKGNQALKATAEKWTEQLKWDVESLEKKLRASIEETYSIENAKQKVPTTKNLIARSLYGVETPEGGVKKVNLATVKNTLAQKLNIEPDSAKREALDKAFTEIVNEVKPLKKLAQQSNKLAILGIVTGVATSAVVGGTVTQWLNDRMVAPTAKKFFAHKKATQPLMGETHKTVSQPVAQKSLSLISAAPAMPMPLNPAAPVYLPNPKMQPSTAHFASLALRPPTSISPFPRTGGGL
jgi:hypothetical protein